MPALSAAWMIIEPFGAVIATPSISMVTWSGATGAAVHGLRRSCRLLHAAPACWSSTRKRLFTIAYSNSCQ